MVTSQVTTLERNELNLTQDGYIIFNKTNKDYELFNKSKTKWETVAKKNPNVFEIFDLSNLPEPVEGVIDITTTNKLYYFYDLVDLEGNEIRFGNNVFRAISQEAAGLKNGIVRILDTCTITDFRFENIEMIINNPTGAFDWNRVNFYNSPNSINVIAADNLIFEVFGFINSANFKISGVINSLAFSPNCIFRSSTNPNSIYFSVENTAVINRRIRGEDSVFSTDFSTQTSVKFHSGATIPDERFRFSNVLFQGIGTSLDGINGNNVKALFRNNEGEGVINSSRFGEMSMQDNTNPTIITTRGVATKVIGTFIPDLENERIEFDAVNNLLIYNGAVSSRCNLSGILNLSSSANKVLIGYICICKFGNTINPVVDKITTSRGFITSATGSRPDMIFLSSVKKLSKGDRVYFAVENVTDETSITCSNSNIIIQAINV